MCNMKGFCLLINLKIIAQLCSLVQLIVWFYGTLIYCKVQSHCSYQACFSSRKPFFQQALSEKYTVCYLPSTQWKRDKVSNLLLKKVKHLSVEELAIFFINQQRINQRVNTGLAFSGGQKHNTNGICCFLWAGCLSSNCLLACQPYRLLYICFVLYFFCPLVAKNPYVNMNPLFFMCNFCFGCKKHVRREVSESNTRYFFLCISSIP